MLIAVASKDGKTIDQHFGHAERFLIYEVIDGDVVLVDEKRVERYCSFDPDHPLRTHTLQATADVLKGCRAIVCAMMGEAPRQELTRLGVEQFVVEGPIEETLVELAKVL